MAKVEQKQPVVEEIKGFVKGAKTIVLVDYRGLTVEQDTALRKKLRDAGIVYKVYKNTMMHFAFKDTDFEQLEQHLKGPTAVAFGMEDETMPVRLLNEAAKEAKALEFKGAVVDGSYYDASGLQLIAKIPSREILLSKLLGSLQSPITNLARVLKQIAEKGDASGEESAEAVEEKETKSAEDVEAKKVGSQEEPAEAVEEKTAEAAAEPVPDSE